ncbi:MAG: hypothetical protein EA422_08645 [Gemmatimonadales bacterium]|nr:MAG: hypothetical protein EA422_08645 [Gemmatimonadales bacterium]
MSGTDLAQLIHRRDVLENLERETAGLANAFGFMMHEPERWLPILTHTHLLLAQHESLIKKLATAVRDAGLVDLDPDAVDRLWELGSAALPVLNKARLAIECATGPAGVILAASEAAVKPVVKKMGKEALAFVGRTAGAKAEAKEAQLAHLRSEMTGTIARVGQIHEDLTRVRAQLDLAIDRYSP